MNKQQYESVIAWQNKVFTKATPLSCAKHLRKEIGELIDDLEAGKTADEEIADCFLLLFGVCNKSGYSYNQILGFIKEKMRINRDRQWGQINDEGFVEHIK